MNRPVARVKCLSVLAQVTLGYYDEEGNLVHEELFPQMDGNVLTAKLFHPQVEQLEKLIQTCVEQAWAKLGAQVKTAMPAGPDEAARNGRALVVSTAEGVPGRDAR
jgi:hypothetical protein